MLSPHPNLVIRRNLELNSSKWVGKTPIKREVVRQIWVIRHSLNVASLCPLWVNPPHKRCKECPNFLVKPLFCHFALNTLNFWVVIPTREHKRIMPGGELPTFPFWESWVLALPPQVIHPILALWRCYETCPAEPVCKGRLHILFPRFAPLLRRFSKDN